MSLRILEPYQIRPPSLLWLFPGIHRDTREQGVLWGLRSHQSSDHDTKSQSQGGPRDQQTKRENFVTSQTKLNSSPVRANRGGGSYCFVFVFLNFLVAQNGSVSFCFCWEFYCVSCFEIRDLYRVFVVRDREMIVWDKLSPFNVFMLLTRFFRQSKVVLKFHRRYI